MEFMVEIEIWKLKLSFETLAAGTVAKRWLGQEKQDGVPERNNYGNLAWMFNLCLALYCRGKTVPY